MSNLSLHFWYPLLSEIISSWKNVRRYWLIFSQTDELFKRNVQVPEDIRPHFYSLPHNWLVSVAHNGMWSTDEPYRAFSPILTSFDKSETFRAVIYSNFGVLLQEKWDLILETGYAALISMYHSLDNSKNWNFKILFLRNFVRSKQNQYKLL